MTPTTEAQARLLNLLAGEVCRLTWQALAVEGVLEEKGLITRADLREAARAAERDWADFTALEGLADRDVALLRAALVARGWRPPARGGGAP